MPKTTKSYQNKKTKSWPEGSRECTQCNCLLPLDSFGIFKQGARGRYPVCNGCRKIKAKIDYTKERSSYKLYYRAKRRAKEKDITFTITEGDIIIPEICPVFKVPMIGKYAPSLDRINSSKGYTADNIQVLSARANTLKNDGTLEEFLLLVAFLESENVETTD